MTIVTLASQRVIEELHRRPTAPHSTAVGDRLSVASTWPRSLPVSDQVPISYHISVKRFELASGLRFFSTQRFTIPDVVHQSFEVLLNDTPVKGRMWRDEDRPARRLQMQYSSNGSLLSVWVHVHVGTRYAYKALIVRDDLNPS